MSIFYSAPSPLQRTNPHAHFHPQVTSFPQPNLFFKDTSLHRTIFSLGNVFSLSSTFPRMDILLGHYPSQKKFLPMECHFVKPIFFSGTTYPWVHIFFLKNVFSPGPHFLGHCPSQRDTFSSLRTFFP
jgi:hypothetical protein